MGSFTARPGKEDEGFAALQALVEPTHAEDGCVLYALHRGGDDPARLAFVERWTSREALSAHLASAHVQDVLTKAEELFGDSGDIVVYEAVPAGRRRRARSPSTPARREARGGRRGRGAAAGGARRGEGGEAAVRAQHPHRETGWFSSPEPGRPHRRSPAGDRRAVLQRRSCSTLAGAGSARARRPRAACTRPAWSPTWTATGARDRGRRRRRARWRRTSSAAAGCGRSRLAGVDVQRRAVPRDARDWRLPTSTATATSRWWRRRRTRRAGAQVFAFDASGAHACPAGRATTRPTPASTASATQGYGAYGENVGIGNLDGDPQQRGRRHVRQPPDQRRSTTTGPRCSRRRGTRTGRTSSSGRRLGWGQFIRWLSPKVEDDHFHRHAGEWPDIATGRGCSGRPHRRRSPTSTATAATRSSGSPTWRRASPYVTQAYAFMALDAVRRARPRGGTRASRRLPLTRKPAVRRRRLYPPSGIPAPTVANLRGGRRREIVASTPDGGVYAVGPTRPRLWRHDFARGAARRSRQQVAAADLDRDGRPELVFGTYGVGAGSGRLVVLSARGRRLYDVRLRGQGTTATASASRPRRRSPTSTATAGSTSWSAPSTTESTSTAYPAHARGRLPWPTGRGGLLRAGT